MRAHFPVLMCLLLAWSGAGAVWAGEGTRPADEAQRILSETGAKGGLVVHVDCGDGKLAAALAANRSYLVHGLSPNAGDVAKARVHIAARGLQGRVSVEHWAGPGLPYADGLANLVVSADPEQVGMEEIRRALCPGGVAWVKRKGAWGKALKAWPEQMDEWTHALHDASNNAVSNDLLVGPPKRMQWVAKPLYSRSHEIDSSISAFVSARGRVFYIWDEGPIGVTDERLPAKWSLVARDAFNGVLLWKRPIPRWGWREWKRGALEGKDWTALRGQRGRFPAEVARRVVAQGDKVYVTLGYVAPLWVLDAATGETLRTFDGTEGTDEIAYSRGVLVLRIRDLAPAAKRRTGTPTPQRIVAVKAETGERLWQATANRMAPLSLAVAGGRVFYHNRREIVCLSLNTGQEQWRTKSVSGGNTLVAQDEVVLAIGGKKLEALATDDGRVLWTAPGGRGPGAVPTPDLFVAHGLVWRGTPIPGLAPANLKGKRRHNRYTGARMVGYDLVTGTIKREVEVKNIISSGHHFRCYRSKATVRYVLWPKRGVEFIDLEGEDHMRHDWLRPPCKLGVVPANGLLYVPPHQCFCYPGAKIGGFNALVAGEKRAEVRRQKSERLQRGPAYRAIENRQSTIENPQDWPTYRHDPQRSGSTGAAVPVDLGRVWTADLGGRITQAVAADGKLFVARGDAHSVHALDAASGREVWSFTTGGPVDSPPTFHRGALLMGSADGWVYCLRASDGALVWRFRAAPEERRIVAFGQVESAWPVHGTVLVKDRVAYVAAGRSSFLDGGIRLCALDPMTGKVLHEGRVEGPYPDLAKDVGRPFDMAGTQADVLVADGTHIYMQQAALDTRLVQQDAPRITNMGDRKMGRHLLSTSGLLDDTWWNRTFWMYSERWPGFYIANQAPKSGQILVFDDSTTYAVKCYTRRNCHSPMFFPGKEGYLLFADDNDNEPCLVGKDRKPTPVQWLPYGTYSSSRGPTPVATPAVDKDKGVGFTRTRPPKWSAWVPVRTRAMVLAGDTLFVAGPLDVLDPSDPAAALEGRTAGVLWAVSAADGKKLAERKLDSPPVFDGMTAANGRVYVATRRGRLLCFGSKP